MSVRNSKPRTSTNYIFANYNSQRFMLCLGEFQTKSILYQTRKKLVEGKLSIPNIENPNNKIILITCTRKEALKFELI